jgi:glycosyltransferase involved in cell wall biosynthesis
MTRSPSIGPIAVLIATRDRPKLLRERALASVRIQSLAADRVVIVNDGVAWTDADREDLADRCGTSEVTCIPNARRRGVGGAWNTGLSRLRELGHDGTVAMLDDDDLWDPDHLERNAAEMSAHEANVVVSGLRIRDRDRIVARPLIRTLDDRDFLVGNPGWQGSNTFVRLSQLIAVGGFRESLASTHDRDLAIRLLRHPLTRTHLLPEWTATWCLDAPNRLSTRGGEAKSSGLRTFLQLYGPEMTAEEHAAFLERARSLFGFEDRGPHTEGSHDRIARVNRGDLDG